MGIHKARAAGRGDQRGAALVEFALVLPLLTLLAFGVVDLGRAYRLKVELTNSAREGGAYAQYFPKQVDGTGSCADPDNVVYAAQRENNPTSASFAITVVDASGNTITGCNTSVVTLNPGDRVKVAAAAPEVVPAVVEVEVAVPRLRPASW